MRRLPESWKQKVDLDRLQEAISAYREAVLWITCENAVGEVQFDLYARKLDRVALHLGINLDAFPFHSFQFTRPKLDRPFLNSPTDHDRLRGVLGWLHRMRHNRPFWRDLKDSDHGDTEATRRILGTVADFERLRRNGTLPGPTKCEPDHAALFRFGLHMGIDRLTTYELADCFNAFCPCNKKHNEDSLKKLRATIRREYEPGWELDQFSPSPLDVDDPWSESDQ